MASKAVDDSATELAAKSRGASPAAAEISVTGGVLGRAKRAAAAATAAAADSVVGVFSQKSESLRSRRFGTSGNLEGRRARPLGDSEKTEMANLPFVLQCVSILLV